MTNPIPAQIQEMINYLAHSYSISMDHPVFGEEDLQQDLLVYYLEKKDKNIINSDGGWFISFKNHLNNKFTRMVKGRKLLERYLNEYKLGVRGT